MSRKLKQPNVALNYIYNLSYQLLAVVLPLITTPYISRVLKAEAIGAYSYCNSIATYFSLFGILGLNMYGQLEISKSRNNKTELSEKFWGIFFAKCLTSSFAIILYLLVALNTAENKSLMLALSTMLFANIIDVTWLYQGLELFKKIVFRNYLIKIVSLILIFALIKDEQDVTLYAIILWGSTLIANLSLWISIPRLIRKIRIHDINIVIHIRNSIPFFIPAIASSIYTVLDKSMLGWIVGSDYENGVYEQAHKIELTAMTIVSSLSTVMLPRMSYLFSAHQVDEYKHYLRKTLLFVGVIAIPMTAGLIAVADVFVPLFLGNGFDKCIILLRIFSVLVIFSGINTIIGNQCLVAQGRQKQYNIGVIIGAITNFGLNLCLIPIASSIGAAIASVSAEAMIFIVFLHYSKADISFKQLILGWKKPIGTSILMGVVVGIIGKTIGPGLITLIIQICAGILVYILALLIFKEEAMQNVLKGLKRKF